MTPYPAFRDILAGTRVKADDLPFQRIAGWAMALGIGLSLFAVAILSPALFIPGWPTRVKDLVTWTYGPGILLTAISLSLVVLGLLVTLLQASHVRAGHFDKQHVAEQALAADLAERHTPSALENVANRLQLEINMIDDAKTGVAAVGAISGAATSTLTVILPKGGLLLASGDLNNLILVVVSAAVCGGSLLFFTYRFREHLTRANHVVHEALRNQSESPVRSETANHLTPPMPSQLR